VWATPDLSGNGGAILFTGAIGDHGKVVSVNADGSPNANGNYVKITLQKGGLMVDSTALNKKADAVQPKLNMATCSGFFTVSAPTTVKSGTGLYAGAHGTVTITETYAFELPRFATGAHKGQCNEGQNTEPVGDWASIEGAGTVTFM
jgi:hypothetical protein